MLVCARKLVHACLNPSFRLPSLNSQTSDLRQKKTPSFWLVMEVVKKCCNPQGERTGLGHGQSCLLTADAAQEIDVVPVFLLIANHFHVPLSRELETASCETIDPAVGVVLTFVGNGKCQHQKLAGINSLNHQALSLAKKMLQFVV